MELELDVIATVADTCGKNNKLNHGLFPERIF